MKIIRVISELDFGGVEKHMELTAEGFNEYSEHQLIFLSLSKGGRTTKAIEEMGFEVIVLNQKPNIPNFVLIRRLIFLFKKLNPDVVHSSGGEANFHGLWAAKLANVPIRIGEEVGFPNHHTYWKLIFKVTFFCSQKVIAISGAVKDKLIELGEASNQRVKVIYYPMGKPKLNSTTDVKTESDRLLTSLVKVQSKNSFVFITTCRLVEVKNLDGLIKVIARLVAKNPDRDIQMWIIGEGPEKENLEQLAVKQQVAKQVKFLGFHQNVNSFLLAADAFVLPSFSEGFSLSLAEAMQLGLPSMATQVGGPSEIIRPGTGLLIDPKDLNDIQAKMQMIIDMAVGERKELGKKGMEDVQKRFSVEKYIEELLDFYEEVREKEIGSNHI